MAAVWIATAAVLRRVVLVERVAVERVVPGIIMPLTLIMVEVVVRIPAAAVVAPAEVPQHTKTVALVVRESLFCVI